MNQQQKKVNQTKTYVYKTASDKGHQMKHKKDIAKGSLRQKYFGGSIRQMSSKEKAKGIR